MHASKTFIINETSFLKVFLSFSQNLHFSGFYDYDLVIRQANSVFHSIFYGSAISENSGTSS